MKKHLIITLLFALNVFISCKSDHAQLSVTETALVKDSVTQMAANIARDISRNGPRAWLNYFEDSPGFFMANQGGLAFHDYQSARVFILNTLVKSIIHIKLRWIHLRIDPVSTDTASIGADFHEDITDAAGKTISVDGYFTGLAHNNGDKWKLRNLHWSVKSPSDK